jgi:hypothetical protein
VNVVRGVCLVFDKSVQEYQGLSKGGQQFKSAAQAHEKALKFLVEIASLQVIVTCV